MTLAQRIISGNEATPRTVEQVLRGRGKAQLFSGKLHLATADFDAALECNPEGAPAAYGNGLARKLVGDADGEENDYRRARDLGYDDST